MWDDLMRVGIAWDRRARNGRPQLSTLLRFFAYLFETLESLHEPLALPPKKALALMMLFDNLDCKSPFEFRGEDGAEWITLTEAGGREFRRDVHIPVPGMGRSDICDSDNAEILTSMFTHRIYKVAEEQAATTAAR